MRAGFGLIGLLVCAGVIVWIMHKSTLPYTQQVLEKGNAARQQVNQMAGNSTDGSMKFSESVVLEAESSGGKIASLDVTQVTPGGPAETYFGLKEGDAIVEIGPLSVKDQINSSGEGRDMVQDAYQRQQQITIVREGIKMTLPVAKPQSNVAKVGNASNKALDETQQEINLHAVPGLP